MEEDPIELSTFMVDRARTYEDGIMYLKTKFNSNYDRFRGRWLDQVNIWLQMNRIENYEDIVEFYDKLWFEHEPFTYEEAFKIDDDEFRALVFSVINVPEMIRHLGTERIKVDGVELENKVYNPTTDKFEIQHLSQIYELHKVNGKALGLESQDIYALKCWCTSTDQEHWLWVDEEAGRQGDPLKAIAGTCKVYKSMLGKIRHIIRQGDVFLFEMLEDVTPSSNEEVVSLDKDTYFKLLKSQS